MPTRSNSPRAMIENSASPLADAIAPTEAVEAEITPPTGACTAICPPSGRVSRASTWPAVTLSPASTITSATFSPIRSGRTWFSSRAMMVPETSTILAKQDFAALSTVTAAPLAGASSSAARAGQRQSKPAVIRAVSFGARSRAAKAGIGNSLSNSGSWISESAPRSQAPRMSPLRQADGLRRRCLERQRNAGQFIRTGDVLRDHRIDR